MPKLIGLVAHRQPVIGRNHVSVRSDGGQDHEVRAFALRANLGHFGWAESAREGKLNVVGDVLVAQHKDRMLLECSAYRCIGCVIRGDIGKGDAAQLGA